MKENRKEITLKNKKTGLLAAINDVFRRLSITVNVTIYTIYLIYLIYCISANIGIKWLNIALAILTGIFTVVYVVLRLSSTKKSKQIKQAKRYYKRFKMIAKAVSSITAVYALIVAFDSVSPFALIAALLGAVFVVLRLITELVIYLIGKAIKKAKNSIANRFKKRTDDEENFAEDTVVSNSSERLTKRRRRREPTLIDEIEEKITPAEECLLSDFEEL